MNERIVIQGLTKTYKKNEALKDVDLTIPAGAIVGLLGPNGSGKTTLLKILTGLIRSYKGTVSIDGRPVGEETKKMISYLPDEPYFADWMRVKDALGIFQDMYEDFDKARCMDMIGRFRIAEKARVRTLSKGTKEKFQLALVLSRRAPIVILDEPIGGVDPAAREVILDTILENYTKDQTLLIATHLIAELERIFDVAIFIREGRILLNKDVESLRMETGRSVDELFRERFRYE